MKYSVTFSFYLYIIKVSFGIGISFATGHGKNKFKIILVSSFKKYYIFPESKKRNSCNNTICSIQTFHGENILCFTLNDFLQNNYSFYYYEM